MMWFAWPALWMMAIVLWWYAPPQSGVRWAAITAFCGGCGALSVVTGDWIIPYFLTNHSANMWVISCWKWFETLTSVISQWGLPYFFFQFAVCFSGWFSPKKMGMIRWITIVCPLSMFYFSPLTVPMKHAFIPLLCWAGPYLLIGITLLIFSQWMESNYIRRMNRRFTNLITIPLISFHLVSNYISRALQNEQFWYWNGLVVWIVFAIFIWLLIRKGVFGIRLHAEQQRHDWSWRAVQTSAASMHHALKGELNKLFWITERMRQDQLNSDSTWIEHLAQTVTQMDTVMTRMYRLTADFQLQLQWNSVKHLIVEACKPFQERFQSIEFQISQPELEQLEWFVDSFHLKEVFRNVLQNAVEAIGGQVGTIRISCQKQRRCFRIIIEDSGCGIPESQWRTIFQPYFSTKANRSNDGFGLFYAYEVLQRHRGWMEVFSKESKGTTMTIVLPIRKVRVRK